MFTEDQRIGYIQEANRRALASNGASDVTKELVKMAQAANMPLDQAEQMMGYKPGVLTGNTGSNLRNGASADPQYTTLSANSNPADVASAYRQWSGANGGDTQANRDTAQSYLSNLGMGSGAINEAYNQYKSGMPQSGNGGGMPQSGNGGGQVDSGTGGGGPPMQGGQNLGFGGPNPYLRGMGVDIGHQLADVWNRQILPGIRSSAIAAGGFGGSRQGVVEANALNDLGRNFVSGMTNLYGNDYTGQQNRNLQRYGMDQSYDLGLRNNDLGFSNLDANINQNNFNNSLQSANFGLGVQNYLNNNNQAGINAGTQMQNTAANYQKYLNDAGNAAGNAGGTRIGTTTI